MSCRRLLGWLLVVTLLSAGSAPVLPSAVASEPSPSVEIDFVGISEESSSIPREHVSAKPGETIRAWYKIQNYEDHGVDVVLGMSVEDSEGTVRSDPAHDSTCSLREGTYTWCNRFFDLHEEAATGDAGVILAIWHDGEQIDRKVLDDSLTLVEGFDPLISRDVPSESQPSFEAPHEQTFRVDVQDDDCDLYYVEWYLDDEFEDKSWVEGCNDTASWTYTFDNTGTHDAVAVVFDERNEEEHSNNVWWGVTITQPDAPPQLVDAGATYEDGRSTTVLEVEQGETIRGWYEIENPSSSSTTVILGMSVAYEKGGGDSDPANDTRCTIPAQSTRFCERVFTIANDAPPGMADVQVAIWSNDWEERYDTITEEDRLKITEPEPEPEPEPDPADGVITSFNTPSGTYEQGASTTTTVTVENTGGEGARFDVRLLHYGPKDYNLPWKETSHLGPGESDTVSWTWTIPSDAPTGTYKSFTQVELDGAVHDDETQDPSFTVSEPEPEASETATIVAFDHPSGTYRGGEVVEGEITIENTGETARSFWVGLSYEQPNGQWYHVPAQETSILDSGETETRTLALSLPSDAPEGDYNAVASIWHDYDASNDEMVEPRFDTERSTDAFSVEEQEHGPGLLGGGVSDPSYAVPRTSINATPGGTIRTWYHVEAASSHRTEVHLGLTVVDSSGDHHTASVQARGCSSIPAGESNWCNRFYELPESLPNGPTDVVLTIHEPETGEELDQLVLADGLLVQQSFHVAFTVKDERGKDLRHAEISVDAGRSLEPPFELLLTNGEHAVSVNPGPGYLLDSWEADGEVALREDSTTPNKAYIRVEGDGQVTLALRRAPSFSISGPDHVEIEPGSTAELTYRVYPHRGYDGAPSVGFVTDQAAPNWLTDQSFTPEEISLEGGQATGVLHLSLAPDAELGPLGGVVLARDGDLLQRLPLTIHVVDAERTEPEDPCPTLSLDGFAVEPAAAAPGSTVTATMNVTAGGAATLWYGMTIRDASGRSHSDPIHDKLASLREGTNQIAREFTIPREVAPGEGDYILALWPDAFESSPCAISPWIPGLEVTSGGDPRISGLSGLPDIHSGRSIDVSVLVNNGQTSRDQLTVEAIVGTGASVEPGPVTLTSLEPWAETSTTFEITPASNSQPLEVTFQISSSGNVYDSETFRVEPAKKEPDRLEITSVSFDSEVYRPGGILNADVTLANRGSRAAFYTLSITTIASDGETIDERSITPLFNNLNVGIPAGERETVRVAAGAGDSEGPIRVVVEAIRGFSVASTWFGTTNVLIDDTLATGDVTVRIPDQEVIAGMPTALLLEITNPSSYAESITILSASLPESVSGTPGDRWYGTTQAMDIVVGGGETKTVGFPIVAGEHSGNVEFIIKDAGQEMGRVREWFDPNPAPEIDLTRNVLADTQRTVTLEIEGVPRTATQVEAQAHYVGTLTGFTKETETILDTSVPDEGSDGSWTFEVPNKEDRDLKFITLELRTPDRSLFRYYERVVEAPADSLLVYDVATHQPRQLTNLDPTEGLVARSTASGTDWYFVADFPQQAGKDGRLPYDYHDLERATMNRVGWFVVGTVEFVVVGLTDPFTGLLKESTGVEVGKPYADHQAPQLRFVLDHHFLEVRESLVYGSEVPEEDALAPRTLVALPKGALLVSGSYQYDPDSDPLGHRSLLALERMLATEGTEARVEALNQDCSVLTLQNKPFVFVYEELNQTNESTLPIGQHLEAAAGCLGQTRATTDIAWIALEIVGGKVISVVWKGVGKPLVESLRVADRLGLSALESFAIRKIFAHGLSDEVAEGLIKTAKDSGYSRFQLARFLKAFDGSGDEFATKVDELLKAYPVKEGVTKKDTSRLLREIHRTAETDDASRLIDSLNELAAEGLKADEAALLTRSLDGDVKASERLAKISKGQTVEGVDFSDIDGEDLIKIFRRPDVPAEAYADLLTYYSKNLRTIEDAWVTGPASTLNEDVPSFIQHYLKHEVIRDYEAKSLLPPDQFPHLYQEIAGESYLKPDVYLKISKRDVAEYDFLRLEGPFSESGGSATSWAIEVLDDTGRGTDSGWAVIERPVQNQGDRVGTSFIPRLQAPEGQTDLVLQWLRDNGFNVNRGASS